MDNLKISHMDVKVVEEMDESLNQKYGKEAPLVIQYGPIWEYLGMTIDYSQPGMFL